MTEPLPPVSDIQSDDFENLFDTPAFSPVEDLIVALLQPLTPYIPGLTVASWLDHDPVCPMILARREPGAFSSSMFSSLDPRWADRTIIQIEVFTADPDADEKGAWLSDIVRRRLMAARLRQEVVKGYGHLNDFQVLSPPHHVTDWATSTGVVQYASLPDGVIRYEARYGITYRPDTRNPPKALGLFQA